MAHPISVRFQNSGLLSPREPVRCYAQELLAFILEDKKWHGCGASVLFCSVSHMRRLNNEFRRLDEPTDVLSFPWLDDPASGPSEPGEYVGDLVICLPLCAHQAREGGRKPHEELALLLVHGLLHLLGYDHDSKRKEKVMWKETDRLLLCAKEIVKPILEVKPLE